MLVTTLASLLTITAAAQDAKPDPRENLDTAVKEAIRLMEAKEYETFIKQFLHPEDLKRLTDSGTSVEEMAKRFAMKKAERNLEVLKELQEKKPQHSDDGRQAFVESEKFKRMPNSKIRFQKVGKLWYIRN